MVEVDHVMKAMDDAEVYFDLLSNVDPRCVRLTPYDDRIYQTFRQDFPELKVDVLNDEELKSPAENIRWRKFAQKFKKLEDYLHGILMRANASQEFTLANTIQVSRVQFLAIEIARNREGCNDELHRKLKTKPRPIPIRFTPN